MEHPVEDANYPQPSTSQFPIDHCTILCSTLLALCFYSCVVYLCFSVVILTTRMVIVRILSEYVSSQQSLIPQLLRIRAL